MIVLLHGIDKTEFQKWKGKKKEIKSNLTGLQERGIDKQSSRLRK